MTSATTPDTARGHASAGHRLTLFWVFKRFVIGLVILTVCVGTAAWLLYASIDEAPLRSQAKLPTIIATPAVASDSNVREIPISGAAQASGQ